jgi:hypothetical protein
MPTLTSSDAFWQHSSGEIAAKFLAVLEAAMVFATL